MKKNEKHKKILNFIKRYKIGVLATVDTEGKPEAASMAFSQTVDLKLIFQTPNYYRKYGNLKKNPNVAVVFGFSLEEFIAVQYEGVAKEAGADEVGKFQKIHITKNPYSVRFTNLPENKYFIVEPKWIRYWDFKTEEKFVLKF